jgi:hypothetical protein
MWPAPYLYLIAAGLGVVLGAVLAVSVGAVWWWFATLALPTLVWIGFLATAFGDRDRDPTDELLTQIVQEIDHRRGALRYERRRAELFRRAPLPRYGLPPSWPGARSLGGHETSDGRVVALELQHGEPQGPGLRVEVRSPAHPPALAALTEELWHTAHRPPPHLAPERFSAWAQEQERMASSWSPRWEQAPLLLEGRSVVADLVRTGDAFVAVARVDEHALVIRGIRWDPEGLELGTIVDLDPYVEGSKRALDSWGG